MSVTAAPVDHLSVTSNSVMSVHDPTADIQYLKGFLPSVLFWTGMTEKVEEKMAGQSAQVELLRSRLPAEYMPEKHSIDLVNTLQVVVASLLALTDGKLVQRPAEVPVPETPPPKAAKMPEPIEISEEEAVLTSPVILLTPRPQIAQDGALGALDDFLKRDDEFLDTAVPVESLDSVKCEAAEIFAPSPRAQPGSEPEPSLAGRSYSCTVTEASEMGDSQREAPVDRSQPTRPEVPPVLFDQLPAEKGAKDTRLHTDRSSEKGAPEVVPEKPLREEAEATQRIEWNVEEMTTKLSEAPLEAGVSLPKEALEAKLRSKRASRCRRKPPAPPPASTESSRETQKGGR